MTHSYTVDQLGAVKNLTNFTPEYRLFHRAVKQPKRMKRQLLDFVLGWTTLDIFSDNFETKKQKEAAAR
jgi:hypothetical protein